VSLWVAFGGILAGVIVWWLAVRRLTTRPWEAQGTADGRDSAGTLGPPPARIGLWGGSYGGYLTAMGLSRASDLFAR